MYYGELKKCDIANGEGVRVSLFVSGCTHHCPGCFNEDTWDFCYGKEYTEATEEEILQALEPGYINGLSLLGGEPFEPQNQEVLVRLLRKVRERYPQKDIWCYSGYLFDRELLGESRARCGYTAGCACGRQIRGEPQGYHAGVPRILQPEADRCEEEFEGRERCAVGAED